MKSVLSSLKKPQREWRENKLEHSVADCQLPKRLGEECSENLHVEITEDKIECQITQQPNQRAQKCSGRNI